MISHELMVMHLLNGASGGAALSTISLIENLEKRGIHSCAVCDDRGTEEERGRVREAVKGRALFTPLYWWNRKTRAALWKRPLLELRQSLRTGCQRWSSRIVARAARDWRADVIHTNTLVTPEGGIASRMLRIPHVWHVRELIGEGLPFQLKLRDAALGNYLKTHCEKVIANSNITAGYISRWVPADLLTTIPNGIDCERFESVATHSHDSKLVVAMVANLPSRWKKHELFIRAAALVNAKHAVDWRIYGHDPSEGGKITTDSYVNSLHQLAGSLGVADCLAFSGHMPPEKIMREIDMLVHPADGESFGRVVVEAMAAGKPVVGVRGGGIAEIILDGQTGLLARVDDAADLARCIEKLILDKSLAQRFGDAGRRRALEMYSMTACADRVASVYEEVLHGRRQDSAAG